VDEPEDVDKDAALPEVIRDTNRPIIIYQGAPQSQLDALTGNSLGLLSWLALLSICIGIVIFSFWRVWNPGHDAKQYSPIYEEGRPLGLAKQVEERRRVNASVEGLIAYIDRIRLDNQDRRRTIATHPLMDDRGGLDELRREWDTMCRSVREGIYDRRLGQIDARIAELRRRQGPETQMLELLRQRRTVSEQRRTDSDPSLQCIPAAAADVCADGRKEPWCNPALTRPDDFIERPQDRP
jgi:hypothetical protein